MSLNVQEQKDELAELRQQAYEALMEIGSQLTAEKVILNDISADSQFNLSKFECCMVGSAFKGSYSYAHDVELGCNTCYNYSYKFYNHQKCGTVRFGDEIMIPNSLSIAGTMAEINEINGKVKPKAKHVLIQNQPTKEFLQDVIKFADHFKMNHK